MVQIIRVYKNEKEFYAGNNIAEFPKFANRNESNTDFANIYLRGIADGMRVRYAHPVAACYEVLEDGSEKLVNKYIG